jgi:hypothetical protein
MKTFWIGLTVVLVAALIVGGSVYYEKINESVPPIDTRPDLMEVAHDPAEAVKKLDAIQQAMAQFVTNIAGEAPDEKKVLTEDFFKLRWLPVVDNAVKIAIVTDDTALIDDLVKVTNNNRKQFPDGTFSKVLIALNQQRPQEFQTAVGTLPSGDQAEFMTHLTKMQAGWITPAANP